MCFYDCTNKPTLQTFINEFIRWQLIVLVGFKQKKKDNIKLSEFRVLVEDSGEKNQCVMLLISIGGK